MKRVWSRLAGLLRKNAMTNSAPVGSELFAAFNEWGGAASGVQVNAITALQHTAVMACVSILAEDVAKLPINLMQRLANGGKRRVGPRQHYRARLLRKPNPWQTRFEFIEMLMASLVLRSNAYAVILRDGDGFPRQLIRCTPTA